MGGILIGSFLISLFFGFLGYTTIDDISMRICYYKVAIIYIIFFASTIAFYFIKNIISKLKAKIIKMLA